MVWGVLTEVVSFKAGAITDKEEIVLPTLLAGVVDPLDCPETLLLKRLLKFLYSLNTISIYTNGSNLPKYPEILGFILFTDALKPLQVLVENGAFSHHRFHNLGRLHLLEILDFQQFMPEPEFLSVGVQHGQRIISCCAQCSTARPFFVFFVE